MRYIIMALIGCFLSFSVQAVTVTEKEDNQTFEVQQGEEITLLLKENPTTGFRWQFQMDPDDSFLEDTFQPSREKGLVGAGGMRLIKWQPRQAGKYHLTGSYQRSWEKKEPIHQLNYYFNVHK